MKKLKIIEKMLKYQLVVVLFFAFASCKGDSKLPEVESKTTNSDAVEKPVIDPGDVERKIVSTKKLEETYGYNRKNKPVSAKPKKEEIKKETKSPLRETKVEQKTEEIQVEAEVLEKEVVSQDGVEIQEPSKVVVEKKVEEVVEEIPAKKEILEEVIELAPHDGLNQLLQKYVSASGVVDYKGLKRDERQLDTYLSSLENNGPQSSWTKDEELAFWINAYNAYTLKLILRNYPLKSITDLHGGKPWDVKWINLDGKNLSLNNIENDIIRPKFNEPRIHFAVNCAAKSCPPLANKAFTASNLESLLEKQTVSFINNSAYNQLSKNEVVVSKIFDWYGEDFTNGVAAFVSKYAKKNVSSDATVNFNEYDWSLNGK